MSMPSGQDLRRALAHGLFLVVGCAPLWFFATHKSEPLFVGHTPELWGPWVVALVVTWVTPGREARRVWLASLLALGGMQLLLVFLLEEVVNFGVYARRWLELGLPAAAWFALLIAVNSLARWLTPDREPAEAYATRAAFVGGMVLSGAGLLAVLTAILAVSPPARAWLLDDAVQFCFNGYAGMMTVIGMSGPVSTWLRLKPDPIAPTAGLAASTAEIEVQRQLRALNRLRVGTQYGSLALVWLAATGAHVALGRSADVAVLLGFYGGLIVALIVTFQVARQFTRAWQRQIRSDGMALAAYRHAARHTALALPESDA